MIKKLGIACFLLLGIAIIATGGYGRGTNTAPASLIDLAPTILAHLGIAAGAMEGSVLPGRGSASVAS